MNPGAQGSLDPPAGALHVRKPIPGPTSLAVFLGTALLVGAFLLHRAR